MLIVPSPLRIAVIPRLVLAPAAVLAPVPPALTGTGVSRTDICPPVMLIVPVKFTLAASCVAMVPRPKLVLAPAAVLALVPPLGMGIGASNPLIYPPPITTEVAFCTAIVPTVVVAPDCNPRLVLALAAVLPPVPPLAMGIGVFNPLMLPPVMLTDS